MIIVRVVPGLQISIDFYQRTDFDRGARLDLCSELTLAGYLRRKMALYQSQQNSRLTDARKRMRRIDARTLA